MTLVKVLLNWPHVLLISGLEAVPRKGALVPPQRYWCEKRLQEIHNTFYFILFVSSLDILKMLFTYGGFQMLRLNPSKVVLLVTAEDSSTTKHTIVLFVEQCINENNILYEGGVYVRKPACMFLRVFFCRFLTNMTMPPWIDNNYACMCYPFWSTSRKILQPGWTCTRMTFCGGFI